MLLPAAAALDRLSSLTAPGAPVAPVVAALGEVATVLEAAGPALEQAKASEWLLGELGRVRGAATTLSGALSDLASRDGMTTFDDAFAADDAGWDATFAEHADIVRRAQGVLDARAGQAGIASTASV